MGSGWFDSWQENEIGSEGHSIQGFVFPEEVPFAEYLISRSHCMAGR